jgi:predicted ABC-type ATPase
VRRDSWARRRVDPVGWQSAWSGESQRVGPHGYIHGWIHVGGSIEEHSPGGKLTPERQALHDRIIAKTLAGTSRSAHPTATFMGGGPASGKSEMLKMRPAKGVIIDPDAIKAQLPEYQSMLDAGDKSAAAYVHEESSAIAKKIVAEAVAGKRDFTLDGTGDGDYAKLAGKVEAARKSGYLTHGQYVTVHTDTAAERAAKRGARTGRVVPETFLRETHAGVSGAFRQAVEHDLFDSAELWDNNSRKELGAIGIKLIGSKTGGGTFSVTDPVAWNQFLAKEHEQWNAAKQHT